MKLTTLIVHHPLKTLLSRLGVAAVLLTLCGIVSAQELKPIKLNAPDKKRGLPVMEALSVKASAKALSDREVSVQDLSDLLWAANGVNRPEEKKFTASSAMNAHDVDLYVFLKDGVYVYDAFEHVLNPVVKGDYRTQVVMTPPKPANSTEPARPAPFTGPVEIILISDGSRFKRGTPEQKTEWGALDTGIVSQNISLFCAATGLKTHPRASMDKTKITSLLKLKETQHIFLEHPIGYEK